VLVQQTNQRELSIGGCSHPQKLTKILLHPRVSNRCSPLSFEERNLVFVTLSSAFVNFWGRSRWRRQLKGAWWKIVGNWGETIWNVIRNKVGREMRYESFRNEKAWSVRKMELGAGLGCHGDGRHTNREGREGGEGRGTLQTSSATPTVPSDGY